MWLEGASLHKGPTLMALNHPIVLGWQLLSNYLVIPVVTVFCPQILVTLLTFDTVTGQISESKWKVTSK